MTYKEFLRLNKHYYGTHAKIAEILAPYKIAPVEWCVLEFIKDEPRIASDISEELGVTLPRISDIGARLRDRKLFIIKSGRNDHRQRIYKLQPAGRALLHKVAKEIEAIGLEAENDPS